MYLQDKKQAFGQLLSFRCLSHCCTVLSSRIVGFCPVLHRTSVLTGPSQAMLSSGLAAKGHTISCQNIITPAEVCQQHPYKHTTNTFPHSSFSLYMAHVPISARLLTSSPLFTSLTLFIIFFTLLRHSWNLKIQEIYMGIINSGKVFMLPTTTPASSTPTAHSGIPRQQLLLPVTCC